MIEDMAVRNLSSATQRSYVYAVAGLGQVFARSPEQLDREDARAFRFTSSGGISWATLNQTVCTLGFLYLATLGGPELPELIAHAREPRKLPTVLSADEVVRFLETVPAQASPVCRLMTRAPEHALLTGNGPVAAERPYSATFRSSSTLIPRSRRTCWRTA